MANKSKNDGTAWETAIVRWLVDNGYPDARRNVLAGTGDLGDIDPVPAARPPIIISAKWGYGAKCSKCNRRAETHPETDKFREWWQELQQARVRRNRAALALLCHHRPGKSSPAGAHWYMDSAQVVTPDNPARHSVYHVGLIKVTGAQALTIMARYATPESSCPTAGTRSLGTP